MKALFTPLLGFLLFSGIAQAQGPDDVITYMSQINQEYHKINQDTWRYISAIARGKNSRKIDARRKDLLQTIRQAEYRVGRIGGYKGDVSLRDSVVAYLKLNYRVLNEDFEKILDMEEIAEESYDLMEAYLLAKERANELLDKAGEQVDASQEAFALKHQVNLVNGQSKLASRLERAGQAFSYYNQFFLIYFKTYKQEAYVMAAMEAGDVGSLEQNNNTLLKFAEQGRQSLDTLPRFKSDATLKIASLRVQNFYKAEAEKYIPAIIDFQLKKEKFEKLQQAMESKKPKDRTKEEIEHFNQAVTAYNAGIKQVNATLNEMNKMREKYLKDWDTAQQNFLAKHASN